MQIFVGNKLSALLWQTFEYLHRFSVGNNLSATLHESHTISKPYDELVSVFSTYWKIVRVRVRGVGGSIKVSMRLTVDCSWMRMTQISAIRLAVFFVLVPTTLAAIQCWVGQETVSNGRRLPTEIGGPYQSGKLIFLQYTFKLYSFFQCSRSTISKTYAPPIN